MPHSMKKIIDNLEVVASYLQNREPKAAAKVAKIAIKLLSQDAPSPDLVKKQLVDQLVDAFHNRAKGEEFPKDLLTALAKKFAAASDIEQPETWVKEFITRAFFAVNNTLNSKSEAIRYLRKLPNYSLDILKSQNRAHHKGEASSLSLEVGPDKMR